MQIDNESIRNNMVDDILDLLERLEIPPSMLKKISKRKEDYGNVDVIFMWIMNNVNLLVELKQKTKKIKELRNI